MLVHFAMSQPSRWGVLLCLALVCVSCGGVGYGPLASGSSAENGIAPVPMMDDIQPPEFWPAVLPADGLQP